jgi:DNA repair exonuclease SbcCD ATPase subunit
MEDTAKFSFERELSALQTIRDELKVKAHLAKADVKDELNRLEAKWERVDEELRRSAAHMKKPLENIGNDTKALVNELKQGYESIKNRLS